MMLPASTCSPPNFFTPRRFELGVATVTRRTTGFLVSHRSAPSFSCAIGLAALVRANLCLTLRRLSAALALAGGSLLGRSLLGGRLVFGRGGFGLRRRQRPSWPAWLRLRSLPTRGQATGAQVHLGLGHQRGLAVPLGVLAGTVDAGDAQDRFHLAMAVGTAIALTTGLLEDLDLLALAGFDQGRGDRRHPRSAGHPGSHPCRRPASGRRRTKRSRQPRHRASRQR